MAQQGVPYGKQHTALHWTSQLNPVPNGGRENLGLNGSALVQKFRVEKGLLAWHFYSPQK